MSGDYLVNPAMNIFVVVTPGLDLLAEMLRYEKLDEQVNIPQQKREEEEN